MTDGTKKKTFQGSVWKPQGITSLPMGDSLSRPSELGSWRRGDLQPSFTDTTAVELDGFDLPADDESDDYSGDGSCHDL